MVSDEQTEQGKLGKGGNNSFNSGTALLQVQQRSAQNKNMDNTTRETAAIPDAYPDVPSTTDPVADAGADLNNLYDIMKYTLRKGGETIPKYIAVSSLLQVGSTGFIDKTIQSLTRYGKSSNGIDAQKVPAENGSTASSASSKHLDIEHEPSDDETEYRKKVRKV